MEGAEMKADRDYHLVAEDPYGRKAYLAIGGEWTLKLTEAHVFDDLKNLETVKILEMEKDVYHTGHRAAPVQVGY
jgi:hypothetical protein